MIRLKNFKKIPNVPYKVLTLLGTVMDLCETSNWNIVAYHSRTYVINLVNGSAKMNIYLSTGTVQTAINHPKKGKTQLNRKNVTPKELEKIFADVRVHTGKGYYKK